MPHPTSPASFLEELRGAQLDLPAEEIAAGADDVFIAPQPGILSCVRRPVGATRIADEILRGSRFHRVEGTRFAFVVGSCAFLLHGVPAYFLTAGIVRTLNRERRSAFPTFYVRDVGAVRAELGGIVPISA